MGRCVSPSAEIQRERNLLDNMDESAQVVIEPLLSHRWFLDVPCGIQSFHNSSRIGAPMR